MILLFSKYSFPGLRKYYCSLLILLALFPGKEASAEEPLFKPLESSAGSLDGGFSRGVTWPSGLARRVEGSGINSFLVITEGQDNPAHLNQKENNNAPS